ncbi:EamA family transporter [Candidatus Aquarickettsia rohweri]|uniref:EamA family transporter n=1 Tax=Candidatus Aquarickettsia rohweri TaxID=2602574 RepID=UPI001F0CD718|nr:EamA family transporter [Candidatus Aquarickettsia rohweri]
MTKEKMLCMLFYSSLFTTIILFIPLLNGFKVPTSKDIFYFTILGIGSNLILFCILKAFDTVKASVLAPLRYIELIFSIILGYFIFNDIPSYNMLIGASIIIPTSLYVILKFK